MNTQLVSWFHKKGAKYRYIVVALILVAVFLVPATPARADNRGYSCRYWSCGHWRAQFCTIGFLG
jgi:hypothetical protein